MNSVTGLPSASIENGFLRVEYLTTTGPRIIGLYARGVNGNLLAETPGIHWPTPHGEFYIRGGHRLWTAPENPFFTCPEDGLNVFRDNRGVVLKSPVDASGLQKEIRLRLEGNRVILFQQVTWHGQNPVELGPWGITQMRLGGMAILPLMHRDGLLPDRSIVLWPYSQVGDDRLELHDDLVLLHGRARSHAFKIGSYTPQGWIAAALGDALFIKRSTVREGRHPDLGCNIEAYVKDAFLELEVLGPLVTLQHGEAAVLEESWEVRAGDFPANLETARIISGLLQ